MPLSASELHLRGRAAANARRFAQARRDLAAASARTDDEDLRARIDGTVAYVLAQTGRPAEAERISREALARPGLGAETAAVLRGQLGTLVMHSGRIDEAEAILTLAIEALPPGTLESANLRMNRAVARMQRHELASCIADLESAVATFQERGETGPLAEARHNLGYAALLAGDLVSALSLMTASRPALAETSALAATIGDLDRAEVLRDAGLSNEAERLLAEVAVRFGAERMRQARGEAEFHLARSLLRHDLPAAERVARTAARRFSSLGNTGWAARSEAVRWESRLRAGAAVGQADIAQTTGDLRDAGFRTEATALALAAAAVGAGRLPRVSPDAPTPLRLRVHEARALRATRAGRGREALRQASAGLELLTSWQQSFGALDLQASAAMHGSDLMFAGLVAAARTRDPATVFEWSERARHLSQQIAPVRPPHDPDLADDLAELRMLRADLAGADWTTDPRVVLLRDRVRERQWATTGTEGARGRVGLAAAQRRAGHGTAILSYVYTGDALQCVAATASAAHIVELDLPAVQQALDGLRADLDVAALTRGGPMGALVERSLDERLRRLDEALLAPVLAAVGAIERAALTAPGLLAGLPWGMLPGLDGIPFTLATSVSRWLDDRTSTRTLRTAGFAAGPRVARAEDEIRRAAAVWSAPDVLTADDAHVSGVIDLAGRSDVLHVAAHGRHAADNPLFSGLELADGTLFGYDVDLITRPPDTVVLSACELGRSSVRWGEEALGMARVWLHAGARCVIAAPVMVADAVAGELLAAVHDGLARGSDPATALADASRMTGHRTPFLCQGSGL